MHTLPLPGDLVWIRQKRWRIERVRRDRNVVRLDVAHRDARLTFLAPFDRPASISRTDGLKRVRPQQALARLAHLIGRTYGLRTLASAVDADMAILPHQLEPALAVMHGARRVLIADEVGLGKTIQAGLIVAELMRRDPASRILVVVPASLRDQWTDELRGRFRVSSSLADARRLDELAQKGAVARSPWERPGVWIGSLDFLKQPHVIDAMPLRPWDLVVVDEAHAACGDSDRHDACHELLQRSRRCVLLSATPHSGDDTRFARLIGLGRVDHDPMTVFRRTRQELGVPNLRRVRWQGVTLSGAERRVLAGLVAFEAVVLRSAGRTGRDQALLLLSVFRKRALSTMGALAKSVDRRVAWLGDPDREDLDWLQPSLGFGDGDDEIGDVEERGALTAHTGMRAAHERSWLRRLRALVEVASRIESKATHLARVLRRTREPVVIFTEFRHSLEVLERRLHLARPLSILHGGQTEAVRRQELDRFLNGTTSVLLATDVAGQGLNLQTRARWVISLELPWNPARIEQRIGRVDRIGQPRSTHATLLVSRDDAESGLLANLARRTLAARQALGEGVLDAAAPDASALRAALIDHAALVPRASATISICRAWRRAALAAARRLRSSRRLIERWRSPADAAKSICTRLTHSAALGLPVGSGALFVFTVPLLDRDGTVVERHVVAVASRTSPARSELAAAIAAARAVAARARVKRGARAQMIARSMAAAAATFEEALTARISEEWVPAEVQPGLFDGRELRVFTAARQSGLTLNDDLAASTERLRRQSTFDPGRPVLELVFVARP